MTDVSHAVEAAGLWKYYSSYPVLRNVSLSAQSGRCLALLGRNGAGKTTLLRILAGLTHYSEGDVRIFGMPSRDRAARRRVGYLGHGIGVYDDLSARENLRHFTRLYELKDGASCVSGWLKRVDLLRVEDAPVREFSRGMRQRLALARVFVHNPDLLLLDEPFTSLDDRSVALLQSLLREAIERGAAVVLSTHQLREALQLATDLCLLDRGKIMFHGPRTAAMLEHPETIYSAAELAH